MYRPVKTSISLILCRGTATRVGQNIPYHALREPLVQILNSRNSKQQDVVSLLVDMLSDKLHLMVDYRGLLNHLLPAMEFEEQRESRKSISRKASGEDIFLKDLPPSKKRKFLIQLLVHFFSLDTPLVLILDDAHW